MTDVYRILGWLVPSLCIVGAGLAINSRHEAFVQANSVHQRAEGELQVATATKAQVESQPVERRYAAADIDPMEETLFLNELRERAHASGTILSKWTSKVSTYGDVAAPISGTGPTDPKTIELLKGLTKIECDLTVSGPYGALRQFMQGLNDSDRLFTVNNVTWVRTDNGTDLTMSLGRYVAPSTKVALKSATANPGALLNR